ncbi:heterokaryon incompatibility protein-domain-containing protein, partial [Tricladium varicosporioides]
MFITNSQPYLTLKSKSGKKLPTVDVNILSQEIDFSAVKTWLSICDGSHGHFCSRGEAQASGLMVVNCTSLRVEPAPIDCRYIALSYVWGDDSPGSITNPLLWPNLPRTVRDAIQVCREINVQYLWVDRYCIDQENDETKLIQIEQMDRIYNTAHCVIIATAGKDANAGLPGVNGNSRLPQMTADVGDYYLISSVDHPRTSIKQSAWNSRGWTFQEGVLARRKLFFTESQMFFEC